MHKRGASSTEEGAPLFVLYKFSLHSFEKDSEKTNTFELFSSMTSKLNVRQPSSYKTPKKRT